jgi:hypothetical protein
MKEVKISGYQLTMDDPFTPAVQGISKVTVPKVCNHWVNYFLFDKPGVIGSGGHSGFQVINISAQFGATGIGLIGFDMQPGGVPHWHGAHPSPLRNPDAARFWQWQKDLDGQAHKLKERDIDVVNCSTVSALTSFPKMTVDQMLERWGL